MFQRVGVRDVRVHTCPESSSCSEFDQEGWLFLCSSNFHTVASSISSTCSIARLGLDFKCQSHGVPSRGSSVAEFLRATSC